MQEHQAHEQALEAAAHAQGAAHHGAEHAQHELPNFVTVLSQLFPDQGWTHFLHRWENVLFSSLAAALILSAFIRSAKKEVLVPEGLRNFCESVVEGIEGFVTGILGSHGREHIPYLGTVFLYVLFMNWSGLIPFFKSPTSSWGTTLALALATMIYVQASGIKAQGLGHYLKHMAGNPSNLFGLVLIPLMLVINLTVEFVAVPLSLSLRLFANVSSEDRLLYKFAELNVLFKGLPFFFQIFANVLAIAFSMVQAFVFMLLSTVYISLLLPHDNHGHEDHGSPAGNGPSHETAHAH